VRRRGDWIPGALAVSAFAGLVVVASIEQEWIYRGGLVAVALVSAVLIHSVSDGRFPARLLEAAPLVAIGAVSYGIYLFHWPVFLLLDETRTGLSGVMLFGLRLVATAMLTIASYRLLEQPIRRGRVGARNGVMIRALGLAAAVIVGASLMVTGPALTVTERLLSSGEQPVVEFLPPVLDAGAGLTADEPRDVPVTPVPPPERILVIGTEETAIQALSRTGFQVIRGLRPQCPISAKATDACEPIDAWFRRLAEQLDPTAVVLAVGAAEDVNAGQQLPIVGDAWKAAEREVTAALDDADDLGLPVVVYYPTASPAPFDAHLERLVLMRPWLGDVARSGDELVDAVTAATAETSPGDRVAELPTDEPMRVMVIGDSTSINLAKALNDGGDGRLAVLWAGANGCPLVVIDGLRVSSDVEWSTPVCEAYEAKLPPLLDRFDPDVVLLGLGPTELAEQRYAGDPNAHIAGDPGFASKHGEALRALLGVLDGDVPLLIADLPAVRTGHFATEEMVDPARLDSVNALVVGADNRWDQVERFNYRGPLEAAELAFGSIRSDGVHPDAAPMESLARDVFVDQLIEQVSAWRANHPAE
jgi:hypothetical protein